VTWHCLNTLFALPETREHQFILYVLEEPVYKDWPKNVSVRVLDPWWPRRDEFRKYLFESRSILRAVEEDHCDVFLSLYQASTILTLPHIMLVHDVIPEVFPIYRKTWRKRFFWSKTKKAIRQAAIYIAVSEHTKLDLVKYLQVETEKIIVSHPSVDPLFEKELHLSEKARVALKYNLPEHYLYHGGGLEVRKNTELVLRSFAALLHILPERERPHLVISGTLHSEKNPLATPVRSLIRELGIEERVLLLGHVPLEDLPALYALASVFVYPSRYEGFGLPVLEAMKVGTPVITTKVSSLPEVGGQAVLYVHPDDREALARSIKKLLHEKELREHLSEDGRLVAERFSWQAFASSLWQQIEKTR